MTPPAVVRRRRPPPRAPRLEEDDLPTSYSGIPAGFWEGMVTVCAIFFILMGLLSLWDIIYIPRR
jgi:hypothetical protein